MTQRGRLYFGRPEVQRDTISHISIDDGTETHDKTNSRCCGGLTHLEFLLLLYRDATKS